MANFKFTPEQTENIKVWKNSLNTEVSQEWYKDENEAEIETQKILKKTSSLKVKI